MAAARARPSSSGRLVEEAGEVGAGHADGRARDRREVDVGGQRLAARVHLKDVEPALLVGQLEADGAIEAAGPQQRRVEDVGAVRRADDDDALGRGEAVDLGEQLVERLALLLGRAARRRPARAPAADGVELVDEDDRGRVFARVLEEVAHAAGADADVHLDEVRAGDRVEGGAGLARQRAGDQRLAAARRAVEQDAARDLRAELARSARCRRGSRRSRAAPDGRVLAGDVVEGDADVVDARGRLAAAERPSPPRTERMKYRKTIVRMSAGSSGVERPDDALEQLLVDARAAASLSRG